MARPESFEVRVNLKVLLIVLAIALPLLALDMLLVSDRSRNALTSLIGGQSEAIAKVAASETSRWVQGKIVNIGVVAASPDVRRVVAQANRRYQGLSQTAMEASFREIDQNWESREAAGVVSRMLSNPASAYLREYLTVNTSFKRLLVTDAQGASVAGSHKPVDYYQADEEWWAASFADGVTGRIVVEDVRLVDPVTATHFVGVNAPIHDPREERVIGVVRAIVDLGDLLLVTRGVRFGETGEVLLVKDDGTVIGSRDPSLLMEQKVEELESIREVASTEKRQSGYTIVKLTGGLRKFLGFADVGLAETFPDLKWTVIVSQDYDEATAPITAINNRILLSAFLAFVLIAAVAVYFSLHRPSKVTDIEEVDKIHKVRHSA
jgi:hypothetical protein